jgi:hypothetical protein
MLSTYIPHQMQSNAAIRPRISNSRSPNVIDIYTASTQHYHPRRSNIDDLFTSLLLLPPGSADVQSTSFPLTPIMLIFVIAGTKATDHADWLAAKALN